MRAGCDERMGILKCIRWCEPKDNCNKLIARRPKPLIVQSKGSSITKQQEIGQYICCIFFYISMFLIFEIVSYDDIILRLAYGANLVETMF
jgi:hypothetical protein